MGADWAGVLISFIALVVATVSFLKSWSDGKHTSRMVAAAELTARANEALAEEARKANEREAARMKLRPLGPAGGNGIPSQSAPRTAAAQAASPSAQRDDHARVTIEKGKGQTYVLRNKGDQTLTGVTLHTDHPAELRRNLPVDQRLAPGQGSAFLLASSLQAPLPTDVLVTWDGQPTGQHLALPA